MKRAAPARAGFGRKLESVIMLGMNYGAQSTPECDPIIHWRHWRRKQAGLSRSMPKGVTIIM